MKNALFLAAFSLFALAATAQKIEFESLEVNYGDIVKGSNGLREFKFKNTGDAPLIIESAKPGCGCTTPKVPKDPIMPGETQVLPVGYDTNRVGQFVKTIAVTSNATNNSTIQLTIRGNVLAEAEPTPAKKENTVIKTN